MLKLNRNSGRRILLASGVAALLIITIYAIRELYPFGRAALLCNDSWQLYIPNLYPRYDALHGGSIAAIMQQTFSGGAFFAKLSSFLLNPLYYFCLIFPRELLQYYPNIMFALCAALSVASAAYCLEKLYPENGLMNTAFALSYGFCGFIIYSFIALPWMALVPLFPLFILALRKLLSDGRGVNFVLITAYFLALNVQIGAMLLLFTLFGSGIYIWLYSEKAERRRLMYQAGIYTLTALLLSGVFLLPNIETLLGSSRASENLIKAPSLLQNIGLVDLYDRLYMSLNPLAAGIVIAALLKKRVTLYKKVAGDYSGACFALLLLLVFTLVCQPSNLIWHLGSYAMFPARYGFMVNMTLLLAASECVKNVRSTPFVVEENALRRRANIIVVVLLLIISIIACVFLQSSISFDIYRLSASIIITRGVCITAILLPILIAGGFIFALTGRRAVQALALASALCYAFFGLFAGIYINNDTSDYTAMQAMYEHDIGGDTLIRMKETRNTLLRNYGNVAGVPTIGGFSASIAENYVEDMLALGYTKAWTSITSSGGTLLTDALLRNGYIIGVRDGDSVSDLYSVYSRFGDYTIYQNPYLLPASFVVESNVFDIEYNPSSPLDNTNLLYQALSSSDAPICEIITSYTEEAGVYKFSVPASNSVLYLDAGCIWSSFEVYVDGRLIEMGDMYDSYSPHRLMELGLYSATVTVSIVPKSVELVPQNVKIGVLDIDMLKELCNSYSDRSAQLTFDGSRICVDVDSKKPGYVFIPIRRINEYTCSVNGSSVDIIPAFGSFVAVEVSAGNSQIVLSEKLGSASLAGLGISAIGAILLGILLIKTRRGIATPNRWICIVSAGYTVILAIGIVVVYLVAFVGFVIAVISKLISYL